MKPFSHSSSSKQFPQLPIDISSSYEIISELGRGAFSTVYKIRHLQTNQDFCLKIINLKKTQDKYNEINLLQKLSHPNLVEFISSFTDDNGIYIIMEYCQYGDLYTLLHSVRKKKVYVNEDIIWDIAYQSLLALEYLHSKHIIHRDIKLLNIFMAKDKVIKIGDFGMSKLLKHKEMKMSRVGTPLYLAPELVKKEKYDYKADIWSLGCSLYHLAKTVPPFNDDNLIRLGYAIVNSEPERLPECYSKDFEGFIKKLMTKNSKDRPSAEMCIKLIPDKVKVKYLNRVKIKDEINKEDVVQFSKTVTSGFDFRHVVHKQGFDQYKSGYSTSASSGICKDNNNNNKSLGFAGKKINMFSKGFPHRKYFQLRHHNIIVSKSTNNAISITTAMSNNNNTNTNGNGNVNMGLNEETKGNNCSMKKLLVNNNNNEMIIHKAKQNVNPLSGMKLQNKTTSYFYKPKIPLFNQDSIKNDKKDNNTNNNSNSNGGNVIVPVIPIIKNEESAKIIDNTALYNKYIKKDIDFFNDDKDSTERGQIVFPQINRNINCNNNNNIFNPSSTAFNFNPTKQTTTNNTSNSSNNILTNRSLFRHTFTANMKFNNPHKKTLTIHDFK